ncbi:molybdopterin molybdotransferase MoeA [Flagellimonas sp.]|uniref:molybdopterin molybdotransferase MoeA n=1 Tax=Flagellimonas sp. TaxID=2058762 RepID=UPI003BB1C27F
MISHDNALQEVLNLSSNFGAEEVGLSDSLGRILAEPIHADRDFPPFDRATKDGIAINFAGIQSADQNFPVSGMAQAGSPQQQLLDATHCIEVMTGAMVPKNADTVIMYEHLEEEDNGFSLRESVKKGQNIHYKASDVAQGEVLLPEGILINEAEIGVLASVGRSKIKVKKLPKVAVISTGNELVDVEDKPEPHQIRKSNVHTLQALLKRLQIPSDCFHFIDNPSILKDKLGEILKNYDVMLLSGGVSKGKFDFLPQTFDALGVEKVFHKVRQRPGKPFWFGQHKKSNTTIFSFPGNPVSTFVSYHVYFKPWLNKTLGMASPQFDVFLKEPTENTTDLTLFIGVRVDWVNGKLMATRISTTGSGDLMALSKADGFIRLKPGKKMEEEQLVPFIPARNRVS